MFTGIIETTGRLVAITPKSGDVTLEIHAPAFDFSHCHLGDSIAVNGICLTAVAFGESSFSADVSRETLDVTTLKHWSVGDSVNLERALTPTTALGGHLVSGHVDGIGTLIEEHPDARSTRLTFQAPHELAKYIARKGSITIDGTSLTVNSVAGDCFSVNVVPHTQERTIIGAYQIQSEVNLEVDLLARYLERLITADPALLEKAPLLAQEDNKTAGLTAARLRELGY